PASVALHLRSSSLVPLRALRSFPTLRSSDLGTLEIPTTELVWWKLTTDSLVRVSLPARRFEVLADPQLVSVPPAAVGETEDHLLDRKSTRLNSSHEKTSYAVFCLKKKNSQIA